MYGPGVFNEVSWVFYGESCSFRGVPNGFMQLQVISMGLQGVFIVILVRFRRFQGELEVVLF